MIARVFNLTLMAKALSLKYEKINVEEDYYPETGVPSAIWYTEGYDMKLLVLAGIPS